VNLAAKILNSLLFGLNISLVGLILHRFTRSRALAGLGCFFTLTSVHLFKVHSNAWTEPLFIFLAIPTLYLLSRYLDEPDDASLIGAGILVGLAILVRYAGVALIATGATAILFWSGSTLTRRLWNLTRFLVPALLPIGFWVSRAIYRGDRPGGREFVFHSIPLEHFHRGLRTLAEWLVPASSPYLIGVSLTVLVAITVLLLVARNMQRRDADPTGPHSPATKRNLFAIFVFFHLGTLVATMLFFDADTRLNYRLLAPAFASTVVALGIFVNGRSQPIRESKLLRWLVVVTISLVAIAHGTAFVEQARATYRYGYGYSNPKWLQSETIRMTAELPEEIALYSNGPMAITILLDRRSGWMPRKWDSRSTLSNEQYADELREVLQEVRDGKACVVHFTSEEEWVPFLPNYDDLREKLEGIVTHQYSDGWILTATN
jgi:4-amino-4-deoxy-L-arabinose transferase-like glycosyltransferase